jgi:beta-mannanase
MISSPWQDCSELPCLTHHFPAAAVQAIRDYGAIPVLSWGSQSTPSTLDQPSMRLSNIYGGAWDGFLSSYATQVREWGHPLFLRFNWEMNGDWFPWAEGVNGNAAGDYVRAWRHVVDAFRAAGADNVTWVWCPNTAFGGSRPIDRLYPGDEYVDWTCIDGYNWGSLRDTPWTSFGSLFRRSYDRITEIAAGKPMLVGETGSSERGGDKAAWLRDALRAITSSRTFPAIRAFMYFNNTVEGDWPIESSRAAQDAFREGIGSPAFTGNEFGTLSGRAPIGPPR